MTKPLMNFGFVIPAPEEDAAMAAGLAADPDTVEFTPAEIARPRAALTMRVDAGTLEALKASGPGR